MENIPERSELICRACCLWLMAVVLLCSAAAANAATERLRVIVETDLGGDPDDEQSMVRFLLYANEWDVEGIIANRPRARDGENRNPERTGLGIARRFIVAYGQCYSNLVQHDERYPKPDLLRTRTVAGYEDARDGVELIVRAVDAADPRPVWFLNWGTDSGSSTSCLRRALDEILKQRGKDGYAKFKERLCLSSADAFGPHTFSIRPPFPIWVDTFRPSFNGRRWYHRFSTITARAGGFDLRRDVLEGHGALGELYPTNTTHWQKEGDTMTFLYLVPTGMNDPMHPERGSWAGRYGLTTNSEAHYFWANETDAWNVSTNRDNTLARWATHLQNDFRARLDWCVKEVGGANHPPRVQVNGRNREVVAGGEILLDASGSSDRDGNSLTAEWIIYPEPKQPGGISIRRRDAMTATLSAAPMEKEGSVDVLAVVTDSGAPPLTRYGRVHVRIAGR